MKKYNFGLLAFFLWFSIMPTLSAVIFDMSYDLKIKTVYAGNFLAISGIILWAIYTIKKEYKL